MELSKITLEIFTKLEQKWLSHRETAARKTRILSIDGGGTTGIVAGASLVRLEDQIRSISGDAEARVADFFDIVIGTGIGAVLAALICSDDGSGKPMLSAREAVSAISRRRSDLFKISYGGLLRRRRRFSGESMEATLRELFTRSDGKVLTLRDTCKNLLVPCFDLNSSAPFVFSRADATESPSFDFEIWKVLRATSATPGLFKPFDLCSIDGKTGVAAVDGGLVMNNPAAAAVTHALHNKRDFPAVNGVEDLLVLSLGNGPSRAGSGPSRAGSGPSPAGECSVSAVVSIVLDGVSETVDQMLGNAFCWNRDDYVRIQAFGLGSEEEGVGPKMAGEVLEERAVVSLPFGGKRLLTETNGERIDSFVLRLVASGKSSLPPSPNKESPVKSSNVR